mmetsp:Transcript_22234/g.41404  ORF Transcript_22234/g.41404 Transcript_22234/m.41404 type:complete len:878 (-) Transcript_22234:98-2731(-)
MQAVLSLDDEDVSLSSTIWYWNNTLQKHILIPFALPRSVRIPNRNVGRAYNFFWYALFILFIFYAASVRIWETDFSIHRHMFSQLDIVDPDPDGFDGKYFKKEHCKDITASRAEYWRGDENAQYHKYAGFTCIARCSSGFRESGTFINPNCFSRGVHSYYFSDNKIMVATHVKRTLTNTTLAQYDNSSMQDSGSQGSGSQIEEKHFWTFSPETERLKLHFGFNVPKPSLFQTLGPMVGSKTSKGSGKKSNYFTAKTGDSDAGFRTYLLNPDGSVMRSVGPGSAVTFTIEELMSMAGHQAQDWLDTQRPEAGQNQRRGSTFGEGPLGRLSGGALLVHARCLDRPVFSSVWSFSAYIFKNFECHISTELVAVPFQSAKTMSYRSDRVMEVERNGITVAVIAGGHFSYANIDMLILYIISFCIIMRIPKFLMGQFMLKYLGLISKMYKNACHENLHVRTSVAGMVARLIQIPIAFMSLSDVRDVYGMGISRQQMRRRLDALIKYAGFRLSTADRSKCLDYLFLMVIKAQISFNFKREARIEKEEAREKKKAKRERKAKRKQAEARADWARVPVAQLSASEIESLTAELRALSSPADRRELIRSLPEDKRRALEQLMESQGKAKHAANGDTGADAQAEGEDDDGPPDARENGQIMSKLERKRRKLHNLVAALEDSFSGISLAKINKALHTGISLGGFFEECTGLENMKISEFVHYVMRNRRDGMLESIFQPAELSPEGITVACRRGHNLSNNIKVWVDEDYLTLQKKMVKRNVEIQENRRRVERAAKEQAKKEREREREQEEGWSELDKARKRLLRMYEDEETHQEELIAEFVGHMKELHKQAAVTQTRLEEINRGIANLQEQRQKQEQYAKQDRAGQTDI